MSYIYIYIYRMTLYHPKSGLRLTMPNGGQQKNPDGSNDGARHASPNDSPRKNDPHWVRIPEVLSIIYRGYPVNSFVLRGLVGEFWLNPHFCSKVLYSHKAITGICYYLCLHIRY